MTFLHETAGHEADETPAHASFPAIETVLPHRGTMLLLDSVSACSTGSLTAHAHVCGDAWYADADGAMPAWIGIELMAQAIAAHVGLLAMRAGGRARPGVLLGSQKYKALIPAFPRDARLFIDAQEVLRSEDGYGAYQCTIGNADDIGSDGTRGISPVTRYAEAVIKVFQPADFQTFIEERNIRP